MTSTALARKMRALDVLKAEQQKLKQGRVAEDRKKVE